MSKQALRITKKRKLVTFWVHPEGRVVGSLFVRTQGPRGEGEEEPLDVLNEEKAFVVVQRQDPEEIRFYNRASIVRVEYREEVRDELAGATPLRCRLHMMDGSLFEGTVMKSLPPDRSRLFDFLNTPHERFIKLYLDEHRTHLINKSYINYVTTFDRE